MNRVATARVMLGLGGLLFSACGGASDPSDQTDQALIACPANTFRLVGSIDQMSVDITEAAAGGFSQDDNGGAFDEGASGLTDGTQMELDWKKGLLDGQTGPATATFQPPRRRSVRRTIVQRGCRDGGSHRQGSIDR